MNIERIVLPLFFAFSASFPMSVKCQETLPEKDGHVLYEEIDSVSGATKSELYSRSKLWFAKSFKSAKDVIQLDDKENGQLVGKGSFFYITGNVLATAEWWANFLVQIDYRDNKARIRITDILLHGTMSDISPDHFNGNKHKEIQKHIKAINSNCIALLSSFKSAISVASTDNF